MNLQVRVDRVAGIEEAQTYSTFPLRTDALDVEVGDYRDGLSQELIEAGDEHAKHARMIWAWIRVRAPRFWWVKMDTYSIGVSKISESTMHTLKSTVRKADKWEDIVPFFCRGTRGVAINTLWTLCKLDAPIEEIKANLPEGWMQTRGINVNYQTLHRIYHQRKSHRLPIWSHFLSQTLSQLPHPQWITAPDSPDQWL